MKQIFLKCLIGTVVATAVSAALHVLFKVDADAKSYAISASIFFVLIFIAELVRDWLKQRRDR